MRRLIVIACGLLALATPTLAQTPVLHLDRALFALGAFVTTDYDFDANADTIEVWERRLVWDTLQEEYRVSAARPSSTIGGLYAPPVLCPGPWFDPVASVRPFFTPAETVAGVSIMRVGRQDYVRVSTSLAIWLVAVTVPACP